MRKFIDIVSEAKMIDGVFTALTFRDLKRMVSEQDLRGVAVDNQIFVAPAYHATHYGMRNSLGLAPYSVGNGDSPSDQHGFNFYAAPSHVYWEGLGDEDGARTLGGREDWAGSRPDFDIQGVAIWIDCDEDVALSNKQFARMVSPTGAS